MNELVQKQFANVASVFGGHTANSADELTSGIQGGFAVMSIRGKAWRVKYQGEETTLMRDDGDGAKTSIDVVLVRAAGPISKIFYKEQYDEGDKEKPDCWSTNGVTPDAGAPHKQSKTCATCKHNIFGSSRSGKGKACQDSKRVAIVPAEDTSGEAWGGPMLLRVPPASLKELPALQNKLNAVGGIPYYAVVTRLKLDHETEYPRIIMTPVCPISDEDDAQNILALRDDPRTLRMLEESIENAVAADTDTRVSEEDVFLEPDAKPAAAFGKAQKTEKAEEKPAPKAQKASKPEPAHDPETGEIMEEEPPKAQKAKAQKAEAKEEPEEEPKRKAAPAEGDETGIPGSFEDELDALLDD